MRASQGKFILFDIDEFAAWLNSTVIARPVTRIQNHHTWTPSYADFDGNNHFALLTGMEESHLGRGFDEIGQNLTTFPDGAVAVCRSLDLTPACTHDANVGTVCIENLGNFDVGGDTMSDSQRAAIIQLNAVLCSAFNITPNSDSIVYHHWYDLETGERKNGSGKTKSCPGTNFFGGNEVADADAHFIPLIAKQVSRLI